MKINNVAMTRGSLIELKHRNAGQMTDEKGRLVKWDEGDLVVILPLGSTRGYLQKAVLAPDASEKIQAKLADAHWGAVVELTIDNRMVTDVEVLLDALAAFYED